MKIILVATSSSGRNLVFVSDSLKVHSLEESIVLTRNREIDNTHVVKRSSGTYVRTNKSVPANQELENLSISSYQLFSRIHNTNLSDFKPLADYMERYQKTLNSQSHNIIRISGWQMVTKAKVKEKLQTHKKYIYNAANHFQVDPYLLGGIIIDEVARIAPFEEITSPLIAKFIGRNTSVGIAQIKIETAVDLIKNEYYNPNPNDKKLAKSQVDSISREYLIKYLVEPKHSIFLAAARIRSIIDRWNRVIYIGDRPEIIATLYPLEDSKKKPHPDPQPNERGARIAGEFYKLAKSFLDTNE